MPSLESTSPKRPSHPAESEVMGIVKNQLFSRNSNDECWLFPGGFLGTRSQVKSFVQKCASDYSKETHWGESFDQKGQLSVADPPCEILLNNNRLCSSRNTVWRLFELQDQLYYGKFGREVFGSRSEIASSLMTSLHKELWFCVSLLGFDFSRLSSGDSIDAQFDFRFAFRSMVVWLPEILILADRISNITGRDIMKELQHIPLYRYQWAGGILELCRIMGRNLNVPCDVCDEEWDLLDQLEYSGFVSILNGNIISRV